MIEKRTLNNEIVAMRKVVKQAKVQIIHKLSREIKGLRSKEGPEDLKEKCNRKADRKKDEIFEIKKLKPDEVSKFALKNLEDPVKKIGDAGVSQELRAYFRFAASKVLSARVNAFREQYPDWKDYIHELLDTLGARRKNLTPTARVTKGPGQNPTAINKNNANPTQNPASINKIPRVAKEEKSSGFVRNRESPQVKYSNKKLNGKISESKESVTPVKKSTFLSQWSVKEMEPVADHSIHTDAHQNEDMRSERLAKEVIVHSKHKPVSQFSGVRRNSGISEVKRFHELCEAQESASGKVKEEPVMDDEVDSDDNDDESAGDQAVDPFFVKPDGKTGYITKMVVEEEGGDDEDEKGGPPSFGRGSKQFRGGQGHSERGGWGGRGGGRGGGQGFRGGRGSFSDRGQPRRGRGGSHGGDKSWSEQSRRGNDRGRRGHDQGSRYAGSNESGRGGNSKFAPKNRATPTESGAHLHPSWEAKRKLQEQSISSIAFQGKKIKFDDDDD